MLKTIVLLNIFCGIFFYVSYAFHIYNFYVQFNASLLNISNLFSKIVNFCVALCHSCLLNDKLVNNKKQISNVFIVNRFYW